MRHLQGLDRGQTSLLPPAIDDYVDEENPVRFLDAFVDSLDLKALGFERVEPKETGRPSYHPADLLKLYLYGYLNRVRSSRRLEAETHRNLEVIWLLRGLRPDHKTIANFRKDNVKAFKAVFRQFVVLCRTLDLFGKELIAVDGTRLKAVNNPEKSFTREKLQVLIRSADERLAEYLERLDRCDSAEGDDPLTAARAKGLAEKIAALKARRDRYDELLSDLERTGQNQVSLTDPDSRTMAASPKVGVGYNAQVAVDTKHKLIVEHEVTNFGSDLGQLASTALAAKEALGVETIQAVADKGYYQGEDIQACEEAGIEAYVPRPQRGAAVRDGLFRKEEFHYDAQSDTYLCPGGARLSPYYQSSTRQHVNLHYCNRQACRACELKARCTTSSHRRIGRWTGEAVLDRMELRLANRPEVMRVRRETVEHPFGTIKQAMNQGFFLMKGLEKVRAEFSLTALAYNLIRVINLVGVKRLREVVLAYFGQKRSGSGLLTDLELRCRPDGPARRLFSAFQAVTSVSVPLAC